MFSANSLTHSDYLPINLGYPFMHDTTEIFDVWCDHKVTIWLIQFIN